MRLSDRHRRFLLVEQGLHPFLLNVVINGLIAWLILRSQPAVPLWGDASMGIDLIATGILLPVLVCQIVSRVIDRQVRGEKVPPLETAVIPATGLHHRSITARSGLLALAATD